MSKVICEICGTSYPDTANQCPICGCSREGWSQNPLADEFEDELPAQAGAKRAKGGRFSTTNVKKRTVSAQPLEDDYRDDDLDEEPMPPRRQNGFLVAILMILVAVLLAATVYLFVRVFLPLVLLPNPSVADPDIVTSTTAPTQQNEETTEPTIPCEELRLESQNIIELNAIGQFYLVHTTVLPSNTTDSVTYASSDESVATVNSEGRITAVSEGVAVITVTCGEQSIECQLICTVSDETEETAETEQETTEATEPKKDLPDIAFNKTDLSFFMLGEQYEIPYTPSEIPAEDITWTSDNSDIVSVENGVLTMRWWGTTKIYAEYDGVKIECIVRVKK